MIRYHKNRCDISHRSGYGTVTPWKGAEPWPRTTYCTIRFSTFFRTSVNNITWSFIIEISNIQVTGRGIGRALLKYMLNLDLWPIYYQVVQPLLQYLLPSLCLTKCWQHSNITWSIVIGTGDIPVTGPGSEQVLLEQVLNLDLWQPTIRLRHLTVTMTDKVDLWRKFHWL